MRFIGLLLLVFGMGVVGGVVGCKGFGGTPRSGNAPPGALADVPNEELRSILAGLARGHDQKGQLAFYVSSPLRPIDGSLRGFYEKMGKEQKELLKELTAWARGQEMDLVFAYSKDVSGQAQKVMEDRQEMLVRADGKEDFQRDNLMQMYNDYEWQVSQIKVLLPMVHDAGLKAYLDKSLKVHEEGSKEVLGLLRRFKLN